MSRTTLAVLGIALAIVLFFAVNLISSLALRGQRLDLTEDKRFSVTESTREVLTSIEEPVTLTLYQSAGLIETAPALRSYATRVDEMLRTYAGIAGDRLRIRRVNPTPFSTEEDRAVSYGLRGVPLNRTGERGYFGLVGTNTVDQLETIELFSPARERFLEYDLTRIVDRLTERVEPTIGVIDGLGMFGDAQQGRYPSALIEMLNDDFELEQLGMDVKVVPDDVDALMIVHPYRLNDQARYAIDQFVLSGKPALVFIDTLAEFSQRAFNNPNIPQFPASDVKPVSDAWGIEIVPEMVVGDANMALQVSGMAPGGRRIQASYLPWLQIRSGMNVLNDADAVTAELQIMRMSSPGSLRPRDGATTTITPLIQTTQQSMLFDEKTVEARPAPSVLTEQFQPSGQVQVLAARVSGPARTAFPDGPPPADPDEQQDPQQPPGREPEPKPHLSESASDINVIVVSDVDMLTNTHIASESGAPNSNNSDFVLNALQNLTGGSELIGLRGRGVSFRPFERIEAIENAAEAQYKSTEQQLTDRLNEIQQRVAQLQQPGAAGEDGVTQVGAVSEETQRAIAEANREMLETREQLRNVQANMRAEIDQLDTRLRLINILLVPGIVVVIGIIVAVWRRARLATYLRRRRHATA